MSEVASPPEVGSGGARQRPSAAPVVLVGIGYDGWEGLAPTACAEIQRAEVLMGSPRHLAMVVLRAWYGRVGGDLVRIAVQHGEPGGDGPMWTETSPVTIWSGNRW